MSIQVTVTSLHPNFSPAKGQPITGDAEINNYYSGFQMTVEKTKTKGITPTNHNKSRQRDEPITVLSNYL